MPLASARQHPENQKENQAGHSSERTAEGQTGARWGAEGAWRVLKTHTCMQPNLLFLSVLGFVCCEILLLSTTSCNHLAVYGKFHSFIQHAFFFDIFGVLWCFSLSLLSGYITPIRPFPLIRRSVARHAQRCHPRPILLYPSFLSSAQPREETCKKA